MSMSCFRAGTTLAFVLALALVVPAEADAAARNAEKESSSSRRGHAKLKPDVVVPKIEILNDYELPENFNNPEGLQKYMEEIQSRNLLPMNQESPPAAKHLLPVVPPEVNSPNLNQWTQGVADMLLERGGITGESRQKVDEYIEMNKPKSPYDGLNLIVFISSSLPDATIRHLVDRLGDSPNVAFAIRGFVDNDASKVMPTMRWLKEHRCRSVGSETVCAQAPMDINPVLFSRLNIRHVPAIAYIPEPKTLENCSEEEPLGEDDYLVFYGDVAPEYILEQIQQARPDDVELQNIVARVKPVIWENAGTPENPATPASANSDENPRSVEQPEQGS
jgi:type-F conjugative transfer system pilin assembly protein TrbC